MPTLLLSLDLSAAFDTIDHSALISRLRSSFGLSGAVLSWIESYLNGRTQFVRIGNNLSSATPLSTGIPQGSVLGPLLFATYTSPIAAICSSHSALQQQFADDTQLFISLTKPNLSLDISRIESCLLDLHYWFCLNGLALNPDKTDSILFGTSQRLQSFAELDSVSAAGVTVRLSDQVKILGVTLDNRLTMDKHVADVCRTCFYHIPAIRLIRRALTDDAARIVACALVGARLDYANSLLYGVSQSNINRLQRVQNSLARVVVGRGAVAPNSSRTLLHHLHWLPVKYRICYKLANFAFRAMNNIAPTYLRTLVRPYVPARSLRSSSANLMAVPPHRLVLGSRSFRVAAPTIWNSLPAEVRGCTSITVFRRQLKTFYFVSAFSDL